MTTTASPQSAVASTETPGFRNTFGGEWIKLRTSRGVRRNLLLGALLGIGFAMLLSFIIGATWDDWSNLDRMDFNALETASAGGLFTVIFFSAAAVNFVATEYSSLMIRLTFSVTPRRSSVIVAKACAIGLATLVTGFIASFLMLLLSQAIFGAYDVPTAGVGSGDFWETVLLATAVAPVFPILAIFLTFMLRSTAASLSTVLAIIFVPAMFGALFPDWWRENVIAALPGQASDSIQLGHLTHSDMYLPRGVAVVVVIAWIVVLFIAARTLVRRRDA